MLDKVRRGELFSDDEKTVWFRRLAILEKMKDEEFIPCKGFKDLYSAYMSVSSTLRHVRRLKEAEEESLASMEEDGDEVMRIGNSPAR